MQFLDQDDVEKGSEAFGRLLTYLVPLFITYRLSGELAVAAPTAVLLYLAVRGLFRLLRKHRP